MLAPLTVRLGDPEDMPEDLRLSSEQVRRAMAPEQLEWALDVFAAALGSGDEVGANEAARVIIRERGREGAEAVRARRALLGREGAG
jgi:hypothetical protein